MRHGGRRGLGLLLGLLMVSSSQARVMADVEMPEQTAVEDHVLTLRRMGLYERTLFNIDVYVWGLYLENGVANAQQSLGRDSARRLHFQFKRGVSRDKVVEGFRSIAGHSAMQQPGMAEGFEQLLSALSGMRKGDELVFTYLPGEGTTLSGDVRQQVTVPGEAFGEALFTAWLDWFAR